MKATALTVRRTREGFELRAAFTYSGKAPTKTQYRDAALSMLEEVNEAANKKTALDGGFAVNSQRQSGVGTVLVDLRPAPAEGGER